MSELPPEKMGGRPQWILEIPGYAAIAIGLGMLVGDGFVAARYFGWLNFRAETYDIVCGGPCFIPVLGMFAGLLGVTPKPFGIPVTRRCQSISRVGVSLLIVHLLFVAVCAYIGGNAPDVQK